MKQSVGNIFTFLFFSILFVSIGCNKETLDFESDRYFDIKELLRSENCNATCGEMADCEGEQVKIRGKLDESNINETDYQFYLIDENENGFRLEIRVDESVSLSVFQKLDGNGGVLFRVEGEMQGYDAPINTTCNRLYTLQISDPSKVRIE